VKVQHQKERGKIRLNGKNKVRDRFGAQSTGAGKPQNEGVKRTIRMNDRKRRKIHHPINRGREATETALSNSGREGRAREEGRGRVSGHKKTGIAQLTREL